MMVVGVDPVAHRAAINSLRKEEPVKKLAVVVAESGVPGSGLSGTDAFKMMLSDRANVLTEEYEAVCETLVIGYIGLSNGRQVPCCPGALVAAILCLLDSEVSAELDRMIKVDMQHILDNATEEECDA